LGNDFIVVQGQPPDGESCAQWARQLCHRQRGIGGDGLVFLTPELEMVIYNSDGSLAQMCGNALRCLGAAAVQSGLLQIGQEVEFKTASGPRALTVTSENPWMVEVDMGEPRLGAVVTYAYAGHDITLQLASMGNPHAVAISPTLPSELWEAAGKEMQTAPFAESDGINVEFVTPGDVLKTFVYERGAGPTLACGTGACAVLAVASAQGVCGPQGRVELPGGILEIDWRDKAHIKMRGPAREVYRGTWTAL
ncbi:unnamed protein product, partial [Phaeothamnion confervicola]